MDTSGGSRGQEDMFTDAVGAWNRGSTEPKLIVPVVMLGGSVTVILARGLVGSDWRTLGGFGDNVLVIAVKQGDESSGGSQAVDDKLGKGGQALVTGGDQRGGGKGRFEIVVEGSGCPSEIVVSGQWGQSSQCGCVIGRERPAQHT